jgi:hypothetical protein
MLCRSCAIIKKLNIQQAKVSEVHKYNHINGKCITLHSNVHRCFVLMTDKVYTAERQRYKNYPVFSKKAMFCVYTKIPLSRINSQANQLHYKEPRYA